MKYPALVLGLLAAMAAPVFAQPSPPPPSGDGPPPAMQQQMDQAHANARTQAMAALSPDHQAAVNAVLSRVKAGQITDAHDAAKQIDAILTAKETQAVLAARDKMRADLRAAMASGGPGPDSGGGPGPGGGYGHGPGAGFGPGGGPPDGGPPGGRRRGGNALRNDPGFVLLTLDLDRDQMRSLFEASRPPQ